MYENMAILSLFAFLYSTVAGKLEKTIFSGPVVYIVFDLICGSSGFGILNIDVKI